MPSYHFRGAALRAEPAFKYLINDIKFSIPLDSPNVPAGPGSHIYSLPPTCYPYHNTQTLTLGLFTDPVIEPYANLSHTWTDNEVTFEDMQDLSTARLRTGFAKIGAACLLAISNDLQDVWIDTCCIEKSSSAELLKAIHSMLSWYKSAGLCYAFLSDLSSSGPTNILNDVQECNALQEAGLFKNSSRQQIFSFSTRNGNSEERKHPALRSV